MKYNINMLLRKKEEIEAWLNQYKITNYELIEDKEYGYVVNVNKSVDLCNKYLKSIDVKFNNINGCFDCSVNQLNSLEGSPVIVNGDFYCSENKLESLEGCPKTVEGNFDCSNNKLISLKYCPKIIEYYFYCSYNKLSIEGLKYLPKAISKNYIYIDNNEKLNDLQNINDFKILKIKVEEILKIKKEKENLLNNINKKDLNKNKVVSKI